jgi:hypothetical protein
MLVSYHQRRKQFVVNETYMSEMIDESVMKLAPVIHFVPVREKINQRRSLLGKLKEIAYIEKGKEE